MVKRRVKKRGGGRKALRERERESEKVALSASLSLEREKRLSSSLSLIEIGKREGGRGEII